MILQALAYKLFDYISNGNGSSGNIIFYSFHPGKFFVIQSSYIINRLRQKSVREFRKLSRESSISK